MRSFITGTGTGIGKTYVTCQLIRAARGLGLRTVALKPLLTGYDPALAGQSDSGLLLRALDQPADDAAIAAITPWRFAHPLSPDWAADLAGASLDLDRICHFCREATDDAEAAFLEGAGGVMVPITPHATTLDWMRALGWPVILVGGSYLGTISHTLTAAAVLAQAGIRFSVVISESEPPAPDFSQTVARIAARLVQPVIGLGRGGLISPAMSKILTG